MLCCLNASCLGETLLALLETKHRGTQTTDLSPYSHALGKAHLCKNTACYGDKAHRNGLSNPHRQKTDVHEKTYTSHQD